MPSDATCAPNFCAGGMNSAQCAALPNSGSGMSPPWQYGKPKCMPGRRRVVELVGRHVVAHHVAAVVGEPQLPSAGCQSKPTVLRTPRAKTSIAVPSGFMRVMEA